MEIQDTVFVVYDFMFKQMPDAHKRARFYDLLQKNGELLLFGSQDFKNGLDVFHFRQTLNFLKESGKKVHPIIWNGSEFGCDFFAENLKFYELEENLVYIEDGVIPLDKYMSFLNKPINKLQNLGFTKKSDNWFKGDDSYEESSLKKYILKRIDEQRPPLTPILKKGKTKKNKICILMQLSHDSNLLNLQDPIVDYPNLIEKTLKEKYKSNFSNLEIIGCPHPKNPDDAYTYDMSAFKNIQASVSPTLAQCMSAELVIGYNSTVLLEAYFKGVSVVALDPNNPLNFLKNEKNDNLLISRIKACQFDPSTISYEDFLIQKATYLKLTKDS